jgi:hypothetical protein
MRVGENQTVETDVPARLDRLPWSRWHTRIIVAPWHLMATGRSRGDTGRLAFRRPREQERPFPD